MYVSLFLQNERVESVDFNILGMAALQLAMKMEEIDIINLNHRLPYSNRYTLPQFEEKIVTSLGMKILPDTLFNWLEIAVEHWDQYTMSSRSVPVGLFFKQKVIGQDTTNGQMVLGQICSGEENMYRKVMQVSDLISLCFDMHKY